MTSAKHTINTITTKSSFIPYSLLSGTFASLASVFAKLFTDTRTLSIAQYFCEVFSDSKNAKFCKEIEKSGKGWENIICSIRILCFASIFLCNALMWNFLTKALNKSSSSVQVTVLNSAINFCMTAILGNIIFGEALALQWWFGAGFIVIGTVLVNISNTVVEGFDKEKTKIQ
ncbi:transmembrane protein 42-like [Gigaspora margarita]|uniref:Transmembrane protein 42-like n=1 Tax=Gigaspora margarita TaxID=4874 RepID=A0A8H3XG16_GIGMA|nr:transmembrane protein 42-like [Gigaspora margarita]